MSKVFWAMLTERNGVSYSESFECLADIVAHNARLKDYYRMVGKPNPIAHARNAACQTFMAASKDPQDTLVMLDVDHIMQVDLVQRLAAHDKGVVGALATTRGQMPFVCVFKRMPDGQYNQMTEWDEGELVEATIVGTGAIAIKRWVLEKLAHCAPSWFRYQYAGYPFEATEDMYFGYECEKAGISHWCDTSLWIPHCVVAYTTPQEWLDYIKDHPEVAQVKPKEMKPIVMEGGDKWATIQQSIQRTL